MAQFPTYNSQQEVSIPRVEETHDVEERFKPINNMIDTMQAVTKQLSDANDVMQETKAKTAAETSFAQQEQAAKNDPNPDNAEFHIQAINDSVKNLPKIDNQEVAGRVNMDIQHSAYLSQIKIQDEFTRKKMVENDTNVLSYADTKAKAVADTISPAQAMQDTEDFNDLIKKQQYTGLLSEGGAKAAVKEFQLGVVSHRINNVNSDKPEDYAKVTDGIPLDLAEQSHVQEMIKNKTEDITKANGVQALNTTVSQLKKVTSGDITWRNQDYIDNLKGNPKTANLGEAMQLVVNNKDKFLPTEKSDQRYMVDLKKTFATENAQQMSDSVTDIIKGQEGKMTSDRLATVIEAADNRMKQLDAIGKPSPVQAAIDGGLKNIENFFKRFGTDGQVTDDYLKATNKGTPPKEAYDTAIQNKIVRDHPESAVHGGTPNKIIDEDGNVFHVLNSKDNIQGTMYWNGKLKIWEPAPTPSGKKNDISSGS